MQTTEAGGGCFPPGGLIQLLLGKIIDRLLTKPVR